MLTPKLAVHFQIFVLLSLGALGGLSANAQEAQPPAFDLLQTKKVLSQEIQKILSETGIPSISIALVKDDEIVWAEAFGYSNVRTKTPATPETLYCTGSTFKFVTAAAVMQLVEQGKLGLDEPVNKYLGDEAIADRSEEGKPVTIRHLLCHYSGLSGPTNTVPLWKRELPMSPSDVVSQIKSARDPGVKYEYCNPGYALAGYIVERVSRQPYEDYIVEHILQPLGVPTPKPVEPTPEMVEVMALPYRLAHNTAIPEAQVRFDVFAAGDIHLTASDMARFLAAQLNGGSHNGNRLLETATVKEMRRVQFAGSNYGLGTMIDRKEGQTIISHGGGLPGFNAYSVGDVDARVGVYLMANASPSLRPLNAIGKLTLELLRGETDTQPLPSFVVKEHKEVSVSSEILAKYVGKYEMRPDFVLTITKEGDKMFVQATGQPRAQMFPMSDSEFFLKIVDAEITFNRDESGKVTGASLHQNGQDEPAKRVE
jgi:D-alanyl-D-alanine-carboxypeptidase/D-alanyl-D-alanine-endopeptidase